jgi:hypothetical protein
MPDSEPHGRTLVPGVQLRHGALLSIVPPGIHPDTGAAIEWTTSLDEVPLAQLPGAWLSGARAGAGRAANGRREYVARDIPEGERHETLLSIAGSPGESIRFSCSNSCAASTPPAARPRHPSAKSTSW